MSNNNRRNKGKGKRTHSKVGTHAGPNSFTNQQSSPHMQIPRRNSINRTYQGNSHVAKQHRWKPSTSPQMNQQQKFNMDPPAPVDGSGPRSFADVVTGKRTSMTDVDATSSNNSNNSNTVGSGSGSGGSGNGSGGIQTSPIRTGVRSSNTHASSTSSSSISLPNQSSSSSSSISSDISIPQVSRPTTTPISVRGSNTNHQQSSGQSAFSQALARSSHHNGNGTSSSSSSNTSIGTPRRVGLKDFERIRVLGKGAFGKVILAREKSTNKIYAMKVLKKTHVLNKRQVEHTMSERYVLGRTQHPFIVGMHYAFQTNDKLVFVLDYCAGGDLYYHISRSGRLPVERARFYTAELVDALAHLHSRGVVYRDLKPENVMMDMDGHVKLVDFGLSKQGITNPVSGASSYCGTPEYLAPEVMQEQASRSYGTAIDWWSLGALLYEMLTGLPPWYNRDRKKMFAGIRGGDLKFPEHVPMDAQSLLRALLCRNPMERLGATTEGVQQIKRHAFFASIDWEALVARKIPPPWKPQAETSQDAEKMSLIYFDKVFTRLPINSNSSPDGSPPIDGVGVNDVNFSSSHKSNNGIAVGGSQFQGFSYMPTSMLETMRVSGNTPQGSPSDMHPMMAPASLTNASFTPPNPQLGGSSFSNSGMNLMQSHYVANSVDNTGQFSDQMSTSPPMQTGIASMMTTHGGSGGFSNFMQGSHQQNHDQDSSDEDLFSVSL